MGTEVILVVGYVVGSLVGAVLGFNHGVRKGAETCVDMMIKNNFVKWRKEKDNIILMKIDQ